MDTPHQFPTDEDGTASSETVRWTVVDQDNWEARVRDVLVGTIAIVLGSAPTFAVASTGGFITGSHSSLENAKAQIESWARWQVRLPWA